MVYFRLEINGGAMRDRTADLLRAKQALSQLSYSPFISKVICVSWCFQVVTLSLLSERSESAESRKFGRPGQT